MPENSLKKKRKKKKRDTHHLCHIFPSGTSPDGYGDICRGPGDIRVKDCLSTGGKGGGGCHVRDAISAVANLSCLEDKNLLHAVTLQKPNWLDRQIGLHD